MILQVAGEDGDEQKMGRNMLDAAELRSLSVHMQICSMYKTLVTRDTVKNETMFSNDGLETIT
jgi:hypothetical protein